MWWQIMPLLMLDEVLGDNFIHWICEYEWSEVSIAILAFHLSLECIKDYLYIEHSIHHIKISKLCPTLKTGSAYTSFHGWNELNLNMYPNPLSTGTHFKLCIQILCQQEVWCIEFVINSWFINVSLPYVQLECNKCYLYIVFFHEKISSIGGIKRKVARGNIQSSPIWQWIIEKPCRTTLANLSAPHLAYISIKAIPRTKFFPSNFF